MKSWNKVWPLLLCVCTLLILMGCQEAPEPTTRPTTLAAEPQLTPREKYDQAKANLMCSPNWILTYTMEERRTVGEDTYIKTVDGKASFSQLYSKDMMAVVEETLSYGSYSSAYMEVYCEGAAYSQVNNSYFKSRMDPEAFVLRQLPAALLDSRLYQTVTQTAGANSVVISFADATALEQWVNKDEAQLLSASGSATLDSTGVLRETACTVTYRVGRVEYSVSAVVQTTAPGGLDLGGAHQEHIKGSKEIESLDVPKMLLQVVGDVYASGKLQCSAVESVYSEAIPLTYSQNSVISLHGRGESLNARAEYQTRLSDDRGTVSTQTQTDTFADGVFSTAANHGEPQPNGSVTAQQMRSYCEDLILSALAAPKYLQEAALVENETACRLEIKGNLDFVTDMMANISQFLRVDLEAKATDKKTVSAEAYVVIDRQTGLPTAMGLNMERQHTIDTVPYQLMYQLEQTMKLSEP